MIPPLGRFSFADPALDARIAISRWAVLITFVTAGALGVLHRERVVAAVRGFLLHASHPINLAVFRIVVFLEVYRAAWTDIIAGTAAQPNALQFPPYTGIPPIGPLAALSHWPVNPLGPAQVTVMIQAMKVACVTGMLGLLTRTSAVAAGVLMLFGWGAQQWYGKVDHFHHLIWFLAILAVSRSGDALSIDALVRSFRRGRAGRSEPPGPSRAYGTPLRVCILLMGVVYFFPGFHKIWTSGFDWFIGPATANRLYQKWHQLGGWVPAFRIDRYPLLLAVGAFGTIVFEMSFLFLVIGRRTRTVVAVAGVTFHTALNAIGRYGFESLRNCYVVFVDWGRGLEWVGRRLYRRPLRVSWDEVPGTGTGWLGCVRGLDWLGAVDWCPRASPEGAMSATIGDRDVRGAAAWGALARRIPLLWPAAPFLALARDGGLGSAAGPGGVPDARAVPPTPRAAPVTGVLILGAAIFVAQVLAGIGRRQEGWPIACYPLFDGLPPAYYTTLSASVAWPDGSEREIELDDFREDFGTRWNFEVQRVLGEVDPGRRDERLVAIRDLLVAEDPEIAGATVRFQEIRVWMKPELRGEPIGEPTLLLEVSP